MLKKIYEELVLIRKELQAIRDYLETSTETKQKPELLQELMDSTKRIQRETGRPIF